jgi:lipopolysaccharide transport system ATP-binding protein
MDSDLAIKVSTISKRYAIGAHKDGSLRGTLAGLVKGKNEKTTQEFWALKDVSFEIKTGDVLGIIGKNGAGKSTLLKVLSQITKPSSGKIEINGRIASLLEVGTGFHPELTGRENIYLNGTILGMTRKEVKEKFVEIVEFSGVQKFIDTPVKHYSSGMYVRLAFAVAAHLEPEILIIDEVLAVGDAEFQKKCMGKMKEVAGKGRTVLFVSHNLSAVASLCNKGIVLNQGSLEFTGSASEAINFYHAMTKKQQLAVNTDLENEHIKVNSFSIEPLVGDLITVASGIRFELHFENKKI